MTESGLGFKFQIICCVWVKLLGQAYDYVFDSTLRLGTRDLNHSLLCIWWI